MSYSKEHIIEDFQRITTWKRNSERAPHKPLLILLAISELLSGKHKISYSEIEDKMINLLIEFGPKRKNYRPNYPFIRLANDDIWEFNKPELLDITKDYSGSI